MNIAIAGGTGFVGTALVDELIKAHHTVFILTRHPEKYHNQSRVHYIGWLYEGARPENALNNLDVVINLAGESLNSGRWTAKRKQKITESRLTATKEMNRILAACTHKPSVVINASAIGVYGVSDQLTFSETTESIGEDFLAQTVKLWEHEALRSKIYSNRVVLARFGLILDQQGGALPTMVLPYKLMAGGTIGRGTQWLSWIHIQDVIRGILFCIDQPKISGPVNFTSPEPTQMKPFGQMISSITHRPHWLPIPSFALKLALGEMSMLVLEGQRVQPTKLLHHHFSFSYPTLKQALTDLLT